eukprot:XP_020400916.1 glutamate receptor 3.1 [Zea mays]
MQLHLESVLLVALGGSTTDLHHTCSTLEDLSLGAFSTQEEEAEAYDIATIKVRGLNAFTKFDMSCYDIKSILDSSTLPFGGTAKRLKETEAAASARDHTGVHRVLELHASVSSHEAAFEHLMCQKVPEVEQGLAAVYQCGTADVFILYNLMRLFSFKDFVSKDNATGSMKGYCIDVFTQALALLPYPVTYRFIPFGNDTENPHYSQLVQMVADNDFDAAIGDIVITMSRTKAVDFTQPFIESGLSFLVVGVVIWILEHRINDDFRGSPRQQIITIVWFSFSTLFLHILDTSIRGLDDLKNSDYPIGFQVGSFVEEYMIKERNISQSRLKALGSPDEYAENLKLGPKKGGVMAIVDERPYVELFLSTYCKIAVAGSDFTSGGWGFFKLCKARSV